MSKEPDKLAELHADITVMQLAIVELAKALDADQLLAEGLEARLATKGVMPRAKIRRFLTRLRKEE